MRGGDWYDQMQVCLNGHQITEYAVSQPQARRNFCPDCGAKTVDACGDCGTPIRGYRHIEGVFMVSDNPPPKYCDNCGSPFPWQQAAIDNVKELVREGELSAQEVAEFEAALPDIIRDTPKTESASLKLKRLLPRVGKPVYDVVIGVISDLASETAKKTMGLG